MKQRFLKMGAGALSLVLFFSNTVFAHSLETNFWSARQLPHLPAPATQLLHPQVSSSLINGFSIPSSVATVRALKKPSNPNGLTVLHVQDVHLNAEAQAHIDVTVKSLIEHQQIGLVALEGAFGELDFSRFQKYSNQAAVISVGDYLLKENRLSGAAHAAFVSSDHAPSLVGVDQKNLYDANVDSYRQSLKFKTTVQNDIAAREIELRARKQKIFSAELKAFDQKISAFQAGTWPLTEYVRFLTRHGDSFEPAIETFLAAADLETHMDWPRVEAERTELLSRVVEKLSKEESQQLVESAVAFRLEKTSAQDFYRQVLHLADSHHVDTRRFATLGRYLQYLSLANAINAEELFNSLSRLEDQRWNALAASQEQKDLVAASRRLALEKKLIDFSLTENEWHQLKSMSALLGANDRLQQPFLNFYRHADLRSGAMTHNLDAEIAKHHAKAAVLVTGGFHSEEMDGELLKKGYTVLSITPRISAVDGKEGTAYLSVFAQERTPLDKLFAGEKLYLSPAPANVAGAAYEIPLVEQATAASSLGAAVQEKISQLGGDSTDATSEKTSAGSNLETKFGKFTLTLVATGVIGSISFGLARHYREQVLHVLMSRATGATVVAVVIGVMMLMAAQDVVTSGRSSDDELFSHLEKIMPLPVAKVFSRNFISDAIRRKGASDLNSALRLLARGGASDIMFNAQDFRDLMAVVRPILATALPRPLRFSLTQRLSHSYWRSSVVEGRYLVNTEALREFLILHPINTKNQKTGVSLLIEYLSAFVIWRKARWEEAHPLPVEQKKEIVPFQDLASNDPFRDFHSATFPGYTEGEMERRFGVPTVGALVRNIAFQKHQPRIYEARKISVELQALIVHSKIFENVAPDVAAKRLEQYPWSLGEFRILKSRGVKTLGELLNTLRARSFMVEKFPSQDVVHLLCRSIAIFEMESGHELMTTYLKSGVLPNDEVEAAYDSAHPPLRTYQRRLRRFLWSVSAALLFFGFDKNVRSEAAPLELNDPGLVLTKTNLFTPAIVVRTTNGWSLKVGEKEIKEIPMQNYSVQTPAPVSTTNQPMRFLFRALLPPGGRGLNPRSDWDLLELARVTGPTNSVPARGDGNALRKGGVQSIRIEGMQPTTFADARATARVFWWLFEHRQVRYTVAFRSLKIEDVDNLAVGLGGTPGLLSVILFEAPEIAAMAPEDFRRIDEVAERFRKQDGGVPVGIEVPSGLSAEQKVAIGNLNSIDFVTVTPEFALQFYGQPNAALKINRELYQPVLFPEGLTPVTVYRPRSPEVDTYSEPSAATKLKMFFLPFLAALGLLHQTEAAAPQIDSVTGSLQKGATIELTGNNFGEKNPAKPLVWIQPDAVGRPSASSLGIRPDVQTKNFSVVQAADGRLVLQGNPGAGDWSVSLNEQLKDGDIAYAQYQIQRNFVVEGGGQNYKSPVRYYYNLGKPDYFNFYYAESNGRAFTEFVDSFDQNGKQVSGGSGFWQGTRLDLTRWSTLESVLKASDIDQKNGFFQERVNGKTVVSGAIQTRSSKRTNYFNNLFFVEEVAANKATWKPAWNPTNSVSIRSVYFDIAHGGKAVPHLVVGDAATFSESKHLMPLIPQKWTPTSITAIATEDELPSGSQHYGYVVNADGEVNEKGILLPSLGLGIQLLRRAGKKKRTTDSETQEMVEAVLAETSKKTFNDDIALAQSLLDEGSVDPVRLAQTLAAEKANKKKAEMIAEAMAVLELSSWYVYFLSNPPKKNFEFQSEASEKLPTTTTDSLEKDSNLSAFTDWLVENWGISLSFEQKKTGLNAIAQGPEKNDHKVRAALSLLAEFVSNRTTFDFTYATDVMNGQAELRKEVEAKKEKARRDTAEKYLLTLLNQLHWTGGPLEPYGALHGWRVKSKGLDIEKKMQLAKEITQTVEQFVNLAAADTQASAVAAAIYLLTSFANERLISVAELQATAPAVEKAFLLMNLESRRKFVGYVVGFRALLPEQKKPKAKPEKQSPSGKNVQLAKRTLDTQDLHAELLPGESLDPVGDFKRAFRHLMAINTINYLPSQITVGVSQLGLQAAWRAAYRITIETSNHEHDGLRDVALYLINRLLQSERLIFREVELKSLAQAVRDHPVRPGVPLDLMRRRSATFFSLLPSALARAQKSEPKVGGSLPSGGGTVVGILILIGLGTLGLVRADTASELVQHTSGLVTQAMKEAPAMSDSVFPSIIWLVVVVAAVTAFLVMKKALKKMLGRTPLLSMSAAILLLAPHAFGQPIPVAPPANISPDAFGPRSMPSEEQKPIIDRFVRLGEKARASITNSVELTPEQRRQLSVEIEAVLSKRRFIVVNTPPGKVMSLASTVGGLVQVFQSALLLGDPTDAEIQNVLEHEFVHLLPEQSDALDFVNQIGPSLPQDPRSYLDPARGSELREKFKQLISVWANQELLAFSVQFAQLGSTDQELLKKFEALANTTKNPTLKNSYYLPWARIARGDESALAGLPFKGRFAVGYLLPIYLQARPQLVQAMQVVAFKDGVNINDVNALARWAWKVMSDAKYKDAYKSKPTPKPVEKKSTLGGVVYVPGSKRSGDSLEDVADEMTDALVAARSGEVTGRQIAKFTFANRIGLNALALPSYCRFVTFNPEDVAKISERIDKNLAQGKSKVRIGRKSVWPWLIDLHSSALHGDSLDRAAPDHHVALALEGGSRSDDEARMVKKLLRKAAFTAQRKLLLVMTPEQVKEPAFANLEAEFPGVKIVLSANALRSGAVLEVEKLAQLIQRQPDGRHLLSNTAIAIPDGVTQYDLDFMTKANQLSFMLIRLSQDLSAIPITSLQINDIVELAKVIKKYA